MTYQASLYINKTSKVNNVFVNPVTVDVLSFLTTDKYKSLVDEYRKTGRGEFPCMTISAVCKGMHSTDSATLNNLICLDIDGKQNPHITDWIEFIYSLKWIEEIYFAGLSRSAYGAMIVMLLKNVTKENFIEYFRHLEHWFKENYRIKIDPACKNVSRLRYASYNDTTTSWHNVDAKPWKRKLPLPKPVSVSVDSPLMFDDLVKWVEKDHQFVAGSANMFTLRLSGACCRFGIPMETCIELLNDRFWMMAPDYHEYVDIWTRTVKGAYKKYELGSALD